MRLVDPAPIRELLDQEVMLRCLSEAASTDRSGDFAAGQAGRRMERRLSIGQMLLDLRRGDLWAERFRAAELRCDARVLRARPAGPSPVARLSARRRPAAQPALVASS